MKKKIGLGLLGLLCVASLASCGQKSAATVKELYEGGETSAGVIAAITNYTSLQLELMSDNTFVYSKSEEHTSELQSPDQLVCRFLLEKKKNVGRLSSHSLEVRSTAELTMTGRWP